ncbi:MAG: hypothetical protein ACYC5H_14940 [Methylovirgula sp.]
MERVKDLIEDWIAIRSTLVRQVDTLRSGQVHAETNVCDTTTEATIVRVEVCIRELNTLLKEYARV